MTSLSAKKRRGEDAVGVFQQDDPRQSWYRVFYEQRKKNRSLVFKDNVAAFKFCDGIGDEFKGGQTRWAARKGLPKILGHLLAQGRDDFDFNELAVASVQGDSIECIELVNKYSELTPFDSQHLCRTQSDAAFKLLREWGVYIDSSHLHEASEEGSLPAVRYLLDNGANVDQLADEFDTPLVHAANKDVAELLLQRGANILGSDEVQLTPLHCTQDKGVAEVLLKYGAQVNHVDGDGMTPLYHAANEGVAEVLLQNGAVVNAFDWYGDTPLHYARDEGVAEILLQNGAYIHTKNNIRGDTPLHEARDEGVAEVLIRNGADVNAKNNDGYTPLHCTRIKGVAEVLIRNGADVNAENNYGVTPLHHIRDKDVAEVLIHNGANVNAKNTGWRTPLHFVRNEDIAEVLLQNGAEIDAEDMDGCTPLHTVIRNFDLCLFKFLIDKGANINSKNQEEDTPLMLACFPDYNDDKWRVDEWNGVKFQTILLEHPDIVLGNGDFMAAAEHNRVECMKMMLNKTKQEVPQMNKVTMTAITNGSVECLKLFDWSDKKNFGDELEGAIRNGRSECLEYLLALCDNPWYERLINLAQCCGKIGCENILKQHRDNNN